MAKLSLDDANWIAGSGGWRDPFLPEHGQGWAAFVPLPDIFKWFSPGVKTHRTWVIAPDATSLERRWQRLQSERDPVRKATLFHEDSGRQIDSKVNVNLGTCAGRDVTVAQDRGALVLPVRYAFRSFDRQWMPPDHRLLTRARPPLWNAHSGQQVYLTAIDDFAPSNGPALTLTALVPDQHHYHGRGGRVYPLWRDSAATEPNLRPELLAFLAESYGAEVGAEDVMAYIAALMAHPAFTARFAPDLVRPGLRVPLTADAALFAEAASLGREIVWLHTYGERFDDASAGRPKQAPRLPKAQAPSIPAEGAIPGAPEPLPDTMDYDASTKRLRIGNGFVANVTPEMWAYEVSGKNVLRQWFSYRKRDRSRPIIGDRRPPSPLDQIQPDHWPAEYTTDLLDLLNVLGRLIALEPAQADLLARICDGPLLAAAALRAAKAIPAENGDKP